MRGDRLTIRRWDAGVQPQPGVYRQSGLGLKPRDFDILGRACVYLDLWC